MNHIPSFLIFPLQLLHTITTGWFHLLQKFFKKIFDFFSCKSQPEKFFFFFLSIQVLSSGMGWIQYNINFYDTVETISISVRWNVFFILGSLLNFFFTGFWRSSWVWTVFLSIQTFLLLLFGYGTLDPHTAFTDFLQTSDYQYSIPYYIFATSLVLSWALGIAIFMEEKKKDRKISIRK
jgi:hypothetical protein